MKKRTIILSLCLILAVTIASFLPCIRNEFFNWDDQSYVMGNPFIRHLSPGNVQKISTTFLVSNYHPLTIVSYAVDYRLYGLNPAGYHLTNVILHALNALLVFWLIFLLTGRNIPVSLITAILFAVHPLQVESVAWISERKNVLYAPFFLGSLICYWYYREKQNSNKFYFLSLVLFLFSLLSKAMAITLPAVLFLLDYLARRKPGKTILTDKIPFFILSVIFGLTAVLGQYTTGAVRNENIFDLPRRIGAASYSIIFYVNKLLIPDKLSCLYPSSSMDDGLVYLFSFLFLLLLAGCVMLTARFTRKIVFGSLFFIVTLLPVLQFIPIGQTIVADRYVYLSSLGLFYIFAFAFMRLYSKKMEYGGSGKPVLAAFIALTIVLAASTFKRCEVWQNSVSLWTDVLKSYPESATAYNGRGAGFFVNKQYDKAYADFTRAINLQPDYHEAYLNLGSVFRAAGNYGEAVRLYKRSIEIHPQNALGYCGLCEVYRSTKKFEDAIISCRTALEINPNLALPAFLLSESYYYTGRRDLALEYYRKATRLGYPVPQQFSELIKKPQK